MDTINQGFEILENSEESYEEIYRRFIERTWIWRIDWDTSPEEITDETPSYEAITAHLFAAFVGDLKEANAYSNAEIKKYYLNGGTELSRRFFCETIWLYIKNYAFEQDLTIDEAIEKLALIFDLSQVMALTSWSTELVDQNIDEFISAIHIDIWQMYEERIREFGQKDFLLAYQKEALKKLEWYSNINGEAINIHDLLDRHFFDYYTLVDLWILEGWSFDDALRYVKNKWKNLKHKPDQRAFLDDIENIFHFQQILKKEVLKTTKNTWIAQWQKKTLKSFYVSEADWIRKEYLLQESLEQLPTHLSWNLLQLFLNFVGNNLQWRWEDGPNFSPLSIEEYVKTLILLSDPEIFSKEVKLWSFSEEKAAKVTNWATNYLKIENNFSFHNPWINSLWREIIDEAPADFFCNFLENACEQHIQKADWSSNTLEINVISTVNSISHDAPETTDMKWTLHLHKNASHQSILWNDLIQRSVAQIHSRKGVSRLGKKTNDWEHDTYICQVEIDGIHLEYHFSVWSIDELLENWEAAWDDQNNEYWLHCTLHISWSEPTAQWTTFIPQAELELSGVSEEWRVGRVNVHYSGPHRASKTTHSYIWNLLGMYEIIDEENDTAEFTKGSFLDSLFWHIELDDEDTNTLKAMVTWSLYKQLTVINNSLGSLSTPYKKLLESYGISTNQEKYSWQYWSYLQHILTHFAVVDEVQPKDRIKPIPHVMLPSHNESNGDRWVYVMLQGWKLWMTTTHSSDTNSFSWDEKTQEAVDTTTSYTYLPLDLVPNKVEKIQQFLSKWISDKIRVFDVSAFNDPKLQTPENTEDLIYTILIHSIFTWSSFNFQHKFKDLLSIEDYAKMTPAFRDSIIARLYTFYWDHIHSFNTSDEFAPLFKLSEHIKQLNDLCLALSSKSLPIESKERDLISYWLERLVGWILQKDLSIKEELWDIQLDDLWEESPNPLTKTMIEKIINEATWMKMYIWDIAYLVHTHNIVFKNENYNILFRKIVQPTQKYIKNWHETYFLSKVNHLMEGCSEIKQYTDIVTWFDTALRLSISDKSHTSELNNLISEYDEIILRIMNLDIRWHDMERVRLLWTFIKKYWFQNNETQWALYKIIKWIIEIAINPRNERESFAHPADVTPDHLPYIFELLDDIWAIRYNLKLYQKDISSPVAITHQGSNNLVTGTVYEGIMKKLFSDIPELNARISQLISVYQTKVSW